jgi:flavin reductase (DIM6/NTAB) family NADH-FMN oxidoreductase RutF
VSAVDPVRFRQLLGTFATGVAVVTAQHPDGTPAGMTASAIASVSLDPPLLLVCVWHEADFHAVISQADHFGLSVLAEDQEDLSRRFSADVADKFHGVVWQMHARGVPLLDGAVAHMVCRRAAQHVAGDHTIFVGEVVDGGTFLRNPLLHVRGGYGRLA